MCTMSTWYPQSSEGTGYPRTAVTENSKLAGIEPGSSAYATTAVTSEPTLLSLLIIFCNTDRLRFSQIAYYLTTLLLLLLLTSRLYGVLSFKLCFIL